MLCKNSSLRCMRCSVSLDMTQVSSSIEMWDFCLKKCWSIPVKYSLMLLSKFTLLFAFINVSSHLKRQCFQFLLYQLLSVMSLLNGEKHHLLTLTLHQFIYRLSSGRIFLSSHELSCTDGQALNVLLLLEYLQALKWCRKNGNGSKNSHLYSTQIQHKTYFTLNSNPNISDKPSGMCLVFLKNKNTRVKVSLCAIYDPEVKPKSRSP